MRRLAAGLIVLGLAAPAMAEDSPQVAKWVVQESWAGGYIGTNPRNRDGILFRLEDGTTLPVAWDEAAGPRTVLKGCEFFLGESSRPCHAVLRAGAVKTGQQMVMIVYHVRSIDPPVWVRNRP